MKTYYYPISSTSLASIFGRACILPASLYRNRLSDIQSKFENFILLTDHFGCMDSDCCLQLVLSSDEEKTLVDIKKGFYLYESALPVSRIKRIYFKNVAQSQRTISNINLSTAFIPNALVDSNNNTFDDVNTNGVEVPENIVPLLEIIEKSYDKFNRILGAMALMKTAHEDGCNYSAHYIDLLSKFNTYIASQKTMISDVDTKFHKVFDNHPTFLDHVVDYATLENEALEKKQFISKSKLTKAIDPSNLENSVYLCYVLYDYGVGEEAHRHKIDELILNNFTSLKQGYQESCALYYGYNRGYASFNNQYRKDNKTEDVKYRLNSLLDYYTIESIYRYTFYNIVSTEFDLFNSWVKTLTGRKAKRGEYQILDTIVCDRKKAILFSEEWWKNCLAFFLQKDKVNFLGYDFSSIIIETILKPFAYLVKEEISYEYEETIQTIKDTNDTEVLRLKKELNKCKEQLSLKDKEIAVPENAVTFSLQTNNQENTCFNEEEYTKKIIELYNLKSKELKELAKQYGCKVGRQSKTEDLIIYILRAEKRQDSKLF